MIDKIKKGIRYLTDPDYRFMINAEAGRYDGMPDEEYLKRLYKSLTGRTLNLENPTRINEKIQWIKLYDRRPEYVMMSDKYLVRQHIAEKIGPRYLIPSLGVWERPEEIDFDALPDRFVLKCNHNSGKGMCICKDKSRLDREKTVSGLREGLAENYFIKGREWCYKDIPRKIVGEQYIENDDGTDISDYKVICGDGEPRCVEVHRARFTAHTLDCYDLSGKRLEVWYKDINTSGISLPDHLPFWKEMLELSRNLAKGIPFVRVDWYYANGQLYFGELTFYHGSGFDELVPDSFNELAGSWITLPEKKTI